MLPRITNTDGVLVDAPHFEGFVLLDFNDFTQDGDVVVCIGSDFTGTPDKGDKLWSSNVGKQVCELISDGSSYMLYRPFGAAPASTQWAQLIDPDTILMKGDAVIIAEGTNPDSLSHSSIPSMAGGFLISTSAGKPYSKAISDSHKRTLWRKVGAVSAPKATVSYIWYQLTGPDDEMKAGDWVMPEGKTPIDAEPSMTIAGYAGLPLKELGKTSSYATVWRKFVIDSGHVTLKWPRWYRLCEYDGLAMAGDVVTLDYEPELSPDSVINHANDSPSMSFVIDGYNGKVINAFIGANQVYWRKVRTEGAPETAAPPAVYHHCVVARVWTQLTDDHTVVCDVDVICDNGRNPVDDPSHVMPVVSELVDKEWGEIREASGGTFTSLWCKDKLNAQYVFEYPSWFEIDDRQCMLVTGDVVMRTSGIDPSTVDTEDCDDPVGYIVSGMSGALIASNVDAAHRVYRLVTYELDGGTAVKTPAPAAARGPRRLPGNRHFGKPLPLP